MDNFLNMFSKYLILKYSKHTNGTYISNINKQKDSFTCAGEDMEGTLCIYLAWQKTQRMLMPHKGHY